MSFPLIPLLPRGKARPPTLVIKAPPVQPPHQFPLPARLSSVLAPFVSIPLGLPVSMNAEGHNRLEKRSE